MELREKREDQTMTETEKMLRLSDVLMCHHEEEVKRDKGENDT